MFKVDLINTIILNNVIKPMKTPYYSQEADFLPVSTSPTYKRISKDSSHNYNQCKTKKMIHSPVNHVSLLKSVGNSIILAHKFTDPCKPSIILAHKFVDPCTALESIQTEFLSLEMESATCRGKLT